MLGKNVQCYIQCSANKFIFYNIKEWTSKFLEKTYQCILAKFGNPL